MRALRLLIASVAAALAFGTGGDASALLAPKKVVLYVHTAIGSTEFVEILLCDLERVLVAPVEARRIDLPLGPEFAATPTQLDVEKVARRFVPATMHEDGPDTFRYLLIPYDLKGGPWNYVFAASFGDERSPFHVGIVSTARLSANEPKNPRRAASITAERVYKLVLKSIARVAGYQKPEGCILAFPRNLQELDRKRDEFCTEDRAALVDAGVLKSREVAACAPIASRLPPVSRVRQG
jgi:predicted Zn-dependent protease